MDSVQGNGLLAWLDAVGGGAVFRSNRPYTITWGDDRNGTTQNDARPGARNTKATGDSYQNIDVALARRIACGSTRSLEFAARRSTC